MTLSRALEQLRALQQRKQPEPHPFELTREQVEGTDDMADQVGRAEEQQ